LQEKSTANFYEVKKVREVEDEVKKRRVVEDEVKKTRW